MLNNAIIQGRFVSTPELRKTANGTAVTKFTLAVPRDYKGKNGQEITDFIDCVAWRQTAEFAAKYFEKGALAVVRGAIEVRNYEDKDGNKRTAVEINADSVYFCERKKRGAEAAPDTAGETPSFEDGIRDISDNEDDLPF